MYSGFTIFDERKKSLMLTVRNLAFFVLITLLIMIFVSNLVLGFNFIMITAMFMFVFQVSNLERLLMVLCLHVYFHCLDLGTLKFLCSHVCDVYMFYFHYLIPLFDYMILSQETNSVIHVYLIKYRYYTSTE